MTKSIEMYKAAKKQEIQELREKLGSSKSYVFEKDNPYVLSSHGNDEIYLDCKVLSVTIEDDDRIDFEVVEPSGDSIIISTEDICYGHIDSITSAIKKELSPLLRQFYDLKKKYPDALLLFRTGDFYETYCKDAEDASKILGITLVKSSKLRDAEDKPLSMAGFPFHALDSYLPKLIRAGRRVAICDQIELPKKEVKRRSITELTK